MKSVFLLGIIEPDPEIQRELKALFHGAGYKIEIASSCSEARAMFRNRKATGESDFDLVLTEHNLVDCNGVEIIEFVRSLQPEIQTVLLTSYDVDSCIDLAIQEDIDSIVAKTKPLEMDELLHTTRALLTRDIFGLEKHLEQETEINEFVITGSEEKEHVIKTISQAVMSLSREREDTREVVALVLDEMISNALYGAPRDQQGKYKYDKGSPVTLKKGEEIYVRYGSDNRLFGFSVADSFGTLSRTDVLDSLARHAHGEEMDMDDETGGGGLFLIRSFIDRFIINIASNVCTETIGLLYLPLAREQAEQRNKSLLIFQTRGENSNGTD